MRRVLGRFSGGVPGAGRGGLVRDVRFLAGLLLLVIGLSLIVTAGGGGGGKGVVDVKLLARRHIVTAAYKVYGNEKLGFWLAKTVVSNKGSAPIYDVEISYRVEGFTDWSQPHRYAAVPPGGAVVDLYYPVLPSSITKLTSATPSKVVVKISYRVTKGSEPVVETFSKQITVLGLNDIVFSSLPPEESTGSFRDTFSNYELIAAWVTPSDPVVIRYAGIVAQLAGGPATSLDDREAIKFLAAAWQYSVANGISYQTESQAYWSGRFSEHVKFPRDVIRDRSGTCIDTAIFFAALAMSQGLRAYIVLMPAHAFPIIELPSGALIPIESTTLNAKVSFQKAVEIGYQVAQRAFSGPHLVIDVAALHAKGIVPPELPELPPNVLEQWGYRAAIAPANQGGQGGGAGGQAAEQGGQGGHQEGGNQGGGNEGGGQGGHGAAALANTRIKPYWAIPLPGEGWQTQIRELTSQQVRGAQAIASSRAMGISILVLWIEGAPGDGLRKAFEQTLQKQGLQLAAKNEKRVEFAGENALRVVYSVNERALLVAYYFSHEGYGFVVAGFLATPSQEAVNTLFSILHGFQWVEGV